MNDPTLQADDLFTRALDGAELGPEVFALNGEGWLPTGIDEAINELFRAEAIKRAAEAALAATREHVAVLLGEGGAYRDADAVYRASRRKPKRIVTPGSENALMGWLGADLQRAVPASAIRITSVRGIAEERYRSEVPINEAMDQAFDDRVQRHVKATEDTFYTWDEDPEAEPGFTLTRVPAHRAPKYLQALEPGATYRPEREKETI